MKTLLVLLLTAVVTQSGCAFLGGAATGVLATGAGYEIQAKRQMDKLDEDFGLKGSRGASMSSASSRSRAVRSFTKDGKRRMTRLHDKKEWVNLC